MAGNLLGTWNSMRLFRQFPASVGIRKKCEFFGGIEKKWVNYLDDPLAHKEQAASNQ